MGKGMIPVVISDNGQDFLPGKIIHHLLDHPVFFAQFKIHLSALSINKFQNRNGRYTHLPVASLNVVEYQDMAFLREASFHLKIPLAFQQAS